MYSKYPKKEVGNVFEKSVAAPFVFYCDVKHLDTSCGSSHVYCYIIVSLHSLAQTINFLPKDNNAIIREHLCGEGLLSLFLCSKLMFFQQKQGILQQVILCPSNKPKIASIRRFDTNNFTQSLTRKYHHTAATESLYRLCHEKISWKPTLAGVPYQFGFGPFPICLQCKISGSSVSSIFPMKFYIIK